jgi:hypothetical protein
VEVDEGLVVVVEPFVPGMVVVVVVVVVDVLGVDPGTEVVDPGPVVVVDRGGAVVVVVVVDVVDVVVGAGGRVVGEGVKRLPAEVPPVAGLDPRTEDRGRPATSSNTVMATTATTKTATIDTASTHQFRWAPEVAGAGSRELRRPSPPETVRRAGPRPLPWLRATRRRSGAPSATAPLAAVRSPT